ncbi:MAG: PAS domain S-box protein [Pirellulaceae bacterium]
MNRSSPTGEQQAEVPPVRTLLDALQVLQAERQQLALEIEQRKRAEAAARESEQQFRAMFQLAAVGMVQLDPHTARFLKANPRYCEITGYSLEELREMTPLDLDHPDERGRDEQLLARLLRREIPEYFNVKRYVRKDGRVIWVMINGSLVLDASGAPIGTIAVVHDVTDRKRAEFQLQESLDREQDRARQLRELAEAGLAIRGDRPFSEILQEVTDRARELIGAHQAVTSFTVDQDWSQAITGLSLSEDYAEFRDYSSPPDGSGIYAMVCETNRAARMTQSQLEAHPRWKGFGEEAVRHPPMRGWLAVPLIAQDGSNLGVIQLSDKYNGDFTEEDEAVVVQLAQMTSTALEIRRAHEELEHGIQERTSELADANEELLRTQQEVAEIASRLALPAREDELQQREYHLDEFSLSDMMDCGAVIRGLSNRQSKRHFADAVVRHLHQRMVDGQGRRSLALVRMFETCRFDELEEVQQTIAQDRYPDVRADTQCLVLLATAGEQAQWNDIRQSRHHQVIPLPSAQAVERQPMIAQLVRQFGFEIGRLLQGDGEVMLEGCDTGVFHVERARGSPHIPAQQDFIVPYGIESVVGFGDVLPDGRLFAVILFSQVAISRETATLVGHLALSTRMALLAHLDLPDGTEQQILSLDHLLRSHERVVAEQEEGLRSTLSRLSASNAELEEFAYVASHDLQEPLRKIRAFGDLLVEEYGHQLGEEGQDYVQRMQRAAGRMQTLIDDLLTLSRVVRKGRSLDQVDLNEVVQSVLIDLEARITSAEATVEVGVLPTVEADPTHMRQLFQNLIGNALKYRRPGVASRVKVAARPTRSESGAKRSKKRLWQITVSDNGIGFEPRQAQQIFQAFQRLHGRGEYEGTGMGLAICRRIVECHGGAIRAEGRPGVGARFIIVLPAQQTLGEAHRVEQK